jgi:hypothetical protein
MKKLLLGLFNLLILVGGCNTHTIVVVQPAPPTTQETKAVKQTLPEHMYLSEHTYFDKHKDEILAECAKRFNKFVVIPGFVVDDKRTWWGMRRYKDNKMYVEDLALAARAMIPSEYEIILYIDNPRGHSIQSPQGVWYFKTNVWNKGPKVSIWSATTTPKQS